MKRDMKEIYLVVPTTRVGVKIVSSCHQAADEKTKHIEILLCLWVDNKKRYPPRGRQ